MAMSYKKALEKMKLSKEIEEEEVSEHYSDEEFEKEEEEGKKSSPKKKEETAKKKEESKSKSKEESPDPVKESALKQAEKKPFASLKPKLMGSRGGKLGSFGKGTPNESALSATVEPPKTKVTELTMSEIFSKMKTSLKSEKDGKRARYLQECMNEDRVNLGFLSLIAYKSAMNRVQLGLDMKYMEKFLLGIECYQRTRDRVLYKKVLNSFYRRVATMDPNDPTLFKRTNPINKPADKQAAAKTIVSNYKNLSLNKKSTEEREFFGFNPHPFLADLRRKLRKSGQSLSDLFKLFDANKDGTLSYEEMKKAFDSAKFGLTAGGLKRIFDIIDTDKSGNISYKEFTTMIEQQDKLVEMSKAGLKERKLKLEREKEQKAKEEEEKAKKDIEEKKSIDKKEPLPKLGKKLENKMDLLFKSETKPILSGDPTIEEQQLKICKTLRKNYFRAEDLFRSLKCRDHKVYFNDFFDSFGKLLSALSRMQLRKVFEEVDGEKKGYLMYKELIYNLYYEPKEAKNLDAKYRTQLEMSILSRLEESRKDMNVSQSIDVTLGDHDHDTSRMSFKPPPDDSMLRDTMKVAHKEAIEPFEKLPLDKSSWDLFLRFCSGVEGECRKSRRPIESLFDFHSSVVNATGTKTMPLSRFKDLAQICLPRCSEEQIRFLFDMFDPYAENLIQPRIFGQQIREVRLVRTLGERLQARLQKGGEYYVHFLVEELETADLEEGSGILPLGKAQGILEAQGLMITPADIPWLSTARILIKHRLADCLNYKNLFQHSLPSTVEDERTRNTRVAILVQKTWRMYKVRKAYRWQLGEKRRLSRRKFKRGKSPKRSEKEQNAERIAGMAQSLSSAKVTKKVRFEEDGTTQPATTLTTKTVRSPKKEGSPHKRKGRQGFKPEPTLQDKIMKSLKGVAGVPQELSRQHILHITGFVQNKLIAQIINNAVSFGESLILSRSIQSKFEQRPVAKHIFPMLQEFQHTVMDPLPRSLQCIHPLGRIIYLNNQGSLDQLDISNKQSLTQIFLGTRLPLKYTPIIDMIADVKSSRLYTLNALWVVEVWSLEQKDSLPVKRFNVVNCEIREDFIEAAYKNRFLNCKPKFLCLEESNNQVLLINTSCVDGCIVFVDPISLSIIKRIHLAFNDYELPKRIRDAIETLKELLTRSLKPDQTLNDLVLQLKKGIDGEISINEFVKRVHNINPTLDTKQIYKIALVIDLNESGSISLEEFTAYIDPAALHSKDPVDMYDYIWPEWVKKANKITMAKEVLTKLLDTLEKQNISAKKAFEIFDADESGDIIGTEFKKVLGKLCPNLEATDIDFLFMIADKNMDNVIQYSEFCEYLDRRKLKIVSVTSKQVEKVLNSNLTNDCSMETLIRKAFQQKLNLRVIFESEDPSRMGLIPRVKFFRLLERLALGYNIENIQEIFKNSPIFDAYGNVDYTNIVRNELFITLENLQLQEESKLTKTEAVTVVTVEDKSLDASKILPEEVLEMSFGESVLDKTVVEDKKVQDNRKVIVEDLVYIDDLDLLVYTTILPKTGTIYITHTVSQAAASRCRKHKKGDSPLNPPVKPIAVEAEKYKLLAILNGHRNYYPPSLLYVGESGCLVSGEKRERDFLHMERMGADPTQTSHLYKEGMHPTKSFHTPGAHSEYQQFLDHTHEESYCEILIWNLQRDMVELFQTCPPWAVDCQRRINAHMGSILDLCYLPTSQLLATCSTDQTVRLFDPIAAPYDLSQSARPLHMTKPGYYTSLNAEGTQKNPCFGEIKRIYMGDSVCYQLRYLNLRSSGAKGVLDKLGGDISLGQSVEWLVGLKLNKPEVFGTRKQSQGFITGFGVERMKLEVPAIRHDDPVPKHIFDECMDLMTQRRVKAATAFRTTLPHNLERLMAQVALQNSMMSQLNALFKSALLQRNVIKYLNPFPLKQIFHLLIDLPSRKKYLKYLSLSGKSSQLSVSEVFFYLKEFNQIHPSNITQQMFLKLVRECKQQHETSLITGVKKWENPAINILAEYIRTKGLDIGQIKKIVGGGREYLTKAEFIECLVSFNLNISAVHIESICRELDPFHTGMFPFQGLADFFKEELHFYNIRSISRPREIISEIRTKIFPQKKLRLQQALAEVDNHGDGFLTLPQLTRAFELAEVPCESELLLSLFECLSERFHPQDEKKVLSIPYFINKLLSVKEKEEFIEIDRILSNIKLSLTYRGFPYEILFSEILNEEEIDFSHLTDKVIPQITKGTFCRRLKKLNVQGVSDSQIAKCGNFMCINNQKRQVIYLTSFLHHIKRIHSAAFTSPVETPKLLAIIGAKLLLNEELFIKVCNELASKKVEEEKIMKIEDSENIELEPSDIRSVLSHFSIHSTHIDIFISTYMDNLPIYTDELLAKIRGSVANTFSLSLNDILMENYKPQDLQIDYFQKLKEIFAHEEELLAIKNRGMGETEALSKPLDILNRCKEFDTRSTGKIRLHHLIHILKHNLEIDPWILAGIQFELTILHPDEYVNYVNFHEMFVLKPKTKEEEDIAAMMVESPTHSKISQSPAKTKSKEKQDNCQKILINLSALLKECKIDIGKAFQLFDQDKDGKITIEELKKTLEWIDFELTESEYEDLFSFINFDKNEYIDLTEFTEAIIHSERICTVFNEGHWLNLSENLLSNEIILALENNSEAIEFLFRKSNPNSRLITREQLEDILREGRIGLSERELENVCEYAVKGSSTPPELEKGKKDLGAASHSLLTVKAGYKTDPGKSKAGSGTDIVHYPYFMQSICKLKEVRKEKGLIKLGEKGDINTLSKGQPIGEGTGRMQKKSEEIVTNKMKEYIKEWGINLYECFYIEGMPDSNITNKELLVGIRMLNLPFTIQEKRTLLKMADPMKTGRINIPLFCGKFETEEIRRMRLDGILEKVAIAIFISGISIKNAFSIFDLDKDGYISKKEFKDAIQYMELGLTGYQIDELMGLVDITANHLISYNEFSDKLNTYIRELEERTKISIQQRLFIRIEAKLHKKQISLLSLFKKYDIEQNGTVAKSELDRIFGNLNMRDLSPREVELILKAGGIEQSQSKFNYEAFCYQFMDTMHSSTNILADNAYDLVRKVYACLKAKHLSVFEGFAIFDVNLTGFLSKMEFVTGIQSFGIGAKKEQISDLWEFALKGKLPKSTKMNYHTFLQLFISAGMIQTDKDDSPLKILIKKFIQEVKASELSIQRIFENFDQKKEGNIFKHNFTAGCMKMNFSGNRDELGMIFDSISKGNKLDDEYIFTYKQWADLLQEFSSHDFLTRLYVRIARNSKKRGIVWKNIFMQFKQDQEEKNKKRDPDIVEALNVNELKTCIRNLRIGFRVDEIEQLVNSLASDKGLISCSSFQEQIEKGASKFERGQKEHWAIIKDFIQKIMDKLKSSNMPIELIFAEFDTNQDGSISLVEFQHLLTKIDAPMDKKESKQLFDAIDRNKSGDIKLSEFKRFLLYYESLGDGDIEDESHIDVNEVEILYERIKQNLDEKRTTFDRVISKNKIEVKYYMNIQKLKQLLEYIGLYVSTREVELIYSNIRSTISKREISYQDFLDFMVRKKIDTTDIREGSIDPTISLCVNTLNRLFRKYQISLERAFMLIAKSLKQGYIVYEDFILALEGMQLGFSKEDTALVFGFLDKNHSNILSKIEFLQGFTAVLQSGKGIEFERIDSTALTRRQQVLKLLTRIGFIFEERGYSFRQMLALFDVNSNGVLSRREFTNVFKQLEIDLSLEQIRLLTTYFDINSQGIIYVADLMNEIQDILNQGTDGMYSALQAKPIIRKIIRELGDDVNSFCDEVAIYEVQLKHSNLNIDFQNPNYVELTDKAGMPKKYFYRVLRKHGIHLKEEDKNLLNAAFGFRQLPIIFDINKLFNLFETFTEATKSEANMYTLEWERKIYKKLGDYIKRNNISITECFGAFDINKSGYITKGEFGNALNSLSIDISERELSILISLADLTQTNKISLRQFAKKFWEAYAFESLNVEEDYRMTKEEQVKMLAGVCKKIKDNKAVGVEKAFSTLDRKGLGFLTLMDLQIGLPRLYSLSLSKERLLLLFKFMDYDDDGVIKLSDFNRFISSTDTQINTKAMEMVSHPHSLDYEIYEHLFKVLQQKHLTLIEIFEEVDENKNGYIDVNEFASLLERLGFVISEKKLNELLLIADENFDGRISFKELYQRVKTIADEMGTGDFQIEADMFRWSDKALEAVVKTLNTLGMKIEDHLHSFDLNHDGWLSSKEFRHSLKAIKSQALSPTQVDRLIHRYCKERATGPEVSIQEFVEILKEYTMTGMANPNSASTKASNEMQIYLNEELFLSLAQNLDGFTKLLDCAALLYDKTYYLVGSKNFGSKHRGLKIMGCQTLLTRGKERLSHLNLTLTDMMLWFSNAALVLLRKSAQNTVVDIKYNLPYATPRDTELGKHILWEVEDCDPLEIKIQTQHGIRLGSGTIVCPGIKPDDSLVNVYIYKYQELYAVSEDGQIYERHLELENSAQLWLAGGGILQPCFGLGGKFEKRTGIEERDKELYILREHINTDEYISMEEFIKDNGGLLGIPLLFGTEGVLYIIRHWALQLLEIIAQMHKVGLLFRTLTPKQIYIRRDGSRIKIGHFRGVGKLSNMGKVIFAPSVAVHANTDELPNEKPANYMESGGNYNNDIFDNAYYAPEHILKKFTEHEPSLDVWSFGMILYSLLFGITPPSFYSIYKQWAQQHLKVNAAMAHRPFRNPSPHTFLYDPLSLIRRTDDNQFYLIKEETESKYIFDYTNTQTALSLSSYSALFDNKNPQFPFNKLEEEGSELAKKEATLGSFLSKMGKIRAEEMMKLSGERESGNKTQIGLLLDLVSCCLDINSNHRPTIQGLIHSPLFKMDEYEMQNAVKFSENVILYRSPSVTINQRLTAPLREMCALVIKTPNMVLQMERELLYIFEYVDSFVKDISTLPIRNIKNITTKSTTLRGKKRDFVKVSPNAPLARQIMEDNVIDMIIFLTLQYLKSQLQFEMPTEAEHMGSTHFGSETMGGILKKHGGAGVSSSPGKENKLKVGKSVRFGELRDMTRSDMDLNERSGVYHQSTSTFNKKPLTKETALRSVLKRSSHAQTNPQTTKAFERTESYRLTKENPILQALCRLLFGLIYEMQEYNECLSEHVGKILEYLMKCICGEVGVFPSDHVLKMKQKDRLTKFLYTRSFYRNYKDFEPQFKGDITDRLWHIKYKNITLMEHPVYWNYHVYSVLLPLFKNAIGESGQGHNQYPVIRDYIATCNQAFEGYSIFGNKTNNLTTCYLTPHQRTSEYYSELLPMVENMSALANPNIGLTAKRGALAGIRAVLLTGNSERIKVCLDVRITQYLIPYIQSKDAEIRTETLTILYEISKGLELDTQLLAHFENSRPGSNLFMKGKKQTKLPETSEKRTDFGSEKKKLSEKNKDYTMINYLGSSGKSDAADTQRFINFAYDLPNLYQRANKPFLKEMATCFRNPMFIMALGRQLRNPVESLTNKLTIIKIFGNLFKGDVEILRTLSNPLCESYVNLARLLIPMDSKTAKQQGPGKTVHDRVYSLFYHSFQSRYPKLLEDMAKMKGLKGILNEFGLEIPLLRTLPGIMGFVDKYIEIINKNILTIGHVYPTDFIELIKDIKAWLYYSVNGSGLDMKIIENAIKKSVMVLAQIGHVVWYEFESKDLNLEENRINVMKMPEAQRINQNIRNEEHRKLLLYILEFFAWLCKQGYSTTLFNEVDGSGIITWLLNSLSYIVSYFRRGSAQFGTETEKLEDTIYGRKAKKVENKHIYEISPFGQLAVYIQDIFSQIIGTKNEEIDQLLIDAQFGTHLGNIFILQFDYLKFCIDHQIERLSLIDVYVEEHELRLSMFEKLVTICPEALRQQFMKTQFIEKLCEEYLKSTLQFNLRFNRINLKFLAFREGYPIRMESLCFVSQILSNKDSSYAIYSEFILHMKRYENMITETKRITNYKNVQGALLDSSLLFFSLILNCDDDRLSFVMKSHGAHMALKTIIEARPHLTRKFPLFRKMEIKKYISKYA